ncbi:hypothetical protein FDN13_01265 [Caloramator sp. E03]|uniref:hypothetical protein n=1 Tax=Caloramator sp. E03 TaxID=2576307 RepID=UPI001110DA4C|nr:hypothetical protein [Caloramator sp. E03]QCX32435.1 hypothetical protein FDN13_01265 [Caloramator sp. E03]
MRSQHEFIFKKECIFEQNTDNIDFEFYIYNINGIVTVILEANKYDDPADYLEQIYNKFRDINFTKTNYIYVDLSNYYGVNCKYWLYKWSFIEENNQLVDVEFEPILYINKITNEFDKQVICEYLQKKFGKFKNN